MPAEALLLPWWSYLYMGVLCIITIAGFRSEMVATLMTPPKAAGHIYSLGVCLLAIYSYSHPTIAQNLGAPIFFGLLIFALVWDVSQAFKDAARLEHMFKKNRIDTLTDEESRRLINFGMFLGFMLLLPAYVMGFAVWLTLAAGS